MANSVFLFPGSINFSGAINAPSTNNIFGAITVNGIPGGNEISVNSSGNIAFGGIPLLMGVAATISSGFGATPSIANSNGAMVTVINVGTGGVASSGVLALPAASTGWVLHCIDITAAAGHTGLRTVQIASTTTTATIESQNSAGAATAWASGSLVRVIALAY